jgi:tRNA A-37 threonylcarbamoyl transferase component Bud32
MLDLPETFRDGRYAVVRVLGEGSQATTFEAVDKKAGRPVAIKRFRVRGAKSWKEVELAEREARVLAGIDHPALPRYVEHFEDGGELFLVTEKIEGDSLAALRTRGAVLSEREVIRLLREASAALDYLHGRAPPIIHRDLKPSNVLRRPDGSFAFIDFGAVRDRMKPEGGSTVVGTFGYMAPEQFQGRAMPVSDVYSIGATALAMLTGREPEELPHTGLAIDVPAALGGARVSPGLVRLLSWMLDPDPDRRAQSIAAGLDGLSRDGQRRAPPFRPPEEPLRGREGREARRRARAEQREQRQAALRLRLREGTPRATGLIYVVLVLGLVAAEIAVTVATRVVVPLVLTLLSIVFGRGLREAARAVSEAGGRATSGIAGARRRLTGAAPEERVRVADAPRARVDVGEAEAEEEAAAVDEASEARRRR